MWGKQHPHSCHVIPTIPPTLHLASSDCSSIMIVLLRKSLSRLQNEKMNEPPLSPFLSFFSSFFSFFSFFLISTWPGLGCCQPILSTLWAKGNKSSVLNLCEGGKQKTFPWQNEASTCNTIRVLLLGERTDKRRGTKDTGAKSQIKIKKWSLFNIF